MKTFALLAALLVLAACQTAPSPEVQTRIQTLEDDKALLSSQRNELKTRAGELEREIDAQKAGSGALTETRDQLVRDRDALLGKTGQLESRLGDLEGRLAMLQAEEARLSRLVDDLKSKNAALVASGQASKSELQRSLEKALSDLQGLEADVGTLQRERDSLALQLKQESDRLDAAVRQLRQALQVEITSGNLDVVRYQNVLIVNIKDSLLFTADSPVLKGDYKPTLATIAKAFAQFPDKVVRVEGHTAVAPSRWSSSWDLGAARAVSVVRYLQDEQGIDPTRLVALSFGEFRPLSPNVDEVGRAKNRRVELVLVDRPLYQVQELLQSLPK